MNDTQSTEDTPKRRRSRKVPKGTKPSPRWAQRIVEPNDAQLARWQELKLPPDDEIVASIIEGANLIWGVPSKEELFRLSDDTHRRHNITGGVDEQNYIKLQYAKRSAIPMSFVRSYPPISDFVGDIVEHNYIVQLQVLTLEMWLDHIKVIHGSRTDDSRAIVFEGTEYPSSAMQRRVRVIRVTVHDYGEQDSYATFEVVADTHYPRSFM